MSFFTLVAVLLPCLSTVYGDEYLLNAEAGKLYYFSHDARTFNESFALCESLNGSLPMIRSQGENDFIRLTSRGETWLSAVTSRRSEEISKSVTWMNGKSASWQPEFNPFTVASCWGVVLTPSGTWTERPCEERHSSVCEFLGGSGLANESEVTGNIEILDVLAMPQQSVSYILSLTYQSLLLTADIQEVATNLKQRLDSTRRTGWNGRWQVIVTRGPIAFHVTPKNTTFLSYRMGAVHVIVYMPLCTSSAGSPAGIAGKPKINLEDGRTMVHLDPVMGEYVVSVRKTLITVIMDESGSMEHLRERVIDGFNLFLQEQQNSSSGDEAYLTLIKFSNEIATVREAAPLGDIAPLTTDDYTPHGGTRLFDAIKNGIEATEQRREFPRYVVIIVTDGEDSTSQDTTSEHIRQIFAEKAGQHSWTILYIGINSPEPEQSFSEQTGLRLGNILDFGEGEALENFSAISFAVSKIRQDRRAQQGNVMDEYRASLNV